VRSIGGPETRRHVLVDGNNLAYRSHYSFVEGRVKAGKPAMFSASGFPTGMIYGFLTILASWLYDVPRITRVSVFFDGSPERRLAMDPSYKSGRSSGVLNAETLFTARDGSMLKGTIEVLTRILLHLGCDVYWSPSEEADDLIASFVSSKPGETHFIMSADKDMFQLVDDRVVVCRPGHEGFFDAERVASHMEKLTRPSSRGTGVRVLPHQIRMFKSLTGDSSDSIPGVQRIRKKSAFSLCSHPDVRSMYDSGLPSLSGSERASVLAARERVELNYALVGLDSGIDLEPLRRTGTLSVPAAIEMCQEDLNMGPLDFASFRLGRVVQPPKPDDMFSDI
jgi:DNA polymerase-1